MPGRDKERFCVLSCPEHSTDLSSPIYQRRPITLSPARFLVIPHESTLGGPYRGYVQKETKMRRESDSSGVRDSLSVADNRVRDGLQPLPGLEEERNFPERKKAGHIRERDLAPAHRKID